MSDAAKLSIEAWITEQTVFITGGSGFIGQAILYKLLLCGCQRIYLLVRPKKGQSIEERMKAILDAAIYDVIKKKDPDLHRRVFPIAGDVTKPGLDISPEDVKVLENEVTVVIHGAASVSFCDPISVAIFTNLRPTRDLLEIATRMKKLQVFNYISTAFSNYEYLNTMFEEEVYPAKMDWQSAIAAAELMPQYVMSTLQNKLLGKMPNTYTFSKHLSEAAVTSYAKRLPVIINRPAIVIGALKEPANGWIINLSSPVAICMAAGKGILRAYYGNSEVNKAYALVEDVVNTSLVSSWRHSVFRDLVTSTSMPAVYNHSYIATPPNDLRRAGEECQKVIPFRNALWPITFFYCDGEYRFLFGHLILHILPALFLDIILKLSGSKFSLIRISRKIYNSQCDLRPFFLSRDQIATKKLKQLASFIPNHEVEKFPLEVATTLVGRFDRFAELAIHVSRNFRKLINDPDPSKEDFVHHVRILWLSRIVKALFWMAIIYFFPYHYLISIYAYFEACIYDIVYDA